MSRRRFLASAAGVLGTAWLPAYGEEQKPSDRGIGGTGITSDAVAATDARVGFWGTIRRFGSIYVNDARISYPSDVAVWVNGTQRTASALQIGQVVRTVAQREDGDRLVTKRIEMLSEVIGPIGSVGDGSIEVMGQTVILGTLPAPSWWQPGVRLSVSGIRTAEGAIVATRIDPAGSLPDQIVGIPKMHGWNLRIGELPLLGIAEQYAGWRVVVRGKLSSGGLKVSRVRIDAPFEGSDVNRLSIETYLERRGSDFHSGTGIAFRDVALDRDVAPRQDVRAVLNIDVARSGGLSLGGLHLEGGANVTPRAMGVGPAGNAVLDPGGASIPVGPDSGFGAIRGAVGLGGGAVAGATSNQGPPAAGPVVGPGMSPGGGFGPRDGLRGHFGGFGEGGGGGMPSRPGRFGR